MPKVIPMMNKQKTFPPMLLALSFLALGNISYARDIIATHSGHYYRLGGGTNLSMGAVSHSRRIPVGGDVNANLGFSCNNFNPAISLGNTFKDLSRSMQGLRGDLMTSATAAVITMPMYWLQKANPELYNQLQNTILDGKDNFNVSMKDCQGALNQIKKGKSPYQDWFAVSDSQGWLDHVKRAKSTPGVDVTAASHDIAKSGKDYGVPWVHKGENSGGKHNQKPIKVLYDVVIAGTNVLINPSRSLDSNTPIPENHELYRYWKTPDSVGKWAQSVLGDVVISAKVDPKTHTVNNTQAGVGLITLLKTCHRQSQDNTCTETIKEQLAKLVTQSGPIEPKALASLNRASLMLTPQIIHHLQTLDDTDKAVAINKISEDLAIGHLIDKALTLRRILIAGAHTNPVQNLKPALLAVERANHDLEQAIHNVMFEHDVKEKLIGNTLQTVLKMGAGQKQLSQQNGPHPTQQYKAQGATYGGNLS